MKPANRTVLRALPSTDRVLNSPELAGLRQSMRRDVLVQLVRQVLTDCRAGVLTGAAPPTLADVVKSVTARAAGLRASPVPVINATGVILHTNLGRAPLSDQAVAAAAAAAAYSDLELDLQTGERGSRQAHVRRLLLALTGAEDAHVAVNNAAAVTLVLATLARGKEVVVSRGQAVEIGGGFRIPSILRQSGARLVEVGTTNRTRLGDYQEAVSDRTGAILHVHSSNFRITGFTESVPLAELAGLARNSGVPLVDDNGSGSLIDTAAFGLAHEPMPIESLQCGVDVVCFSGDKLLGGPQSGIILGREDLVSRISRYPLARALRPDKMTLAALSATLTAYLGQDAVTTLPVWRMIAQSADVVRDRAERWRTLAGGRGLEVELRPGESTVGGGSLPGETLSTTLIVLPKAIKAASLRGATPPVITRSHRGEALIDLRTVTSEQERDLLEAVIGVAQAVQRGQNPVIDSAT